jgi:hypothetical protein
MNPRQIKHSHPKVKVATGASEGLKVSVEKENEVALQNALKIREYAVKKYRLASAVSLLGTVGGCFLAYKKGSGVWGYVGYGLLLGGIVGGMVGMTIGTVVLKAPDLKVK